MSSQQKLYCALKKKMDLIISVLTTENKKLKKPQRNTKETFGGDGCIFYFACGDSFTSVCVYPNSSNCSQ